MLDRKRKKMVSNVTAVLLTALLETSLVCIQTREEGFQVNFGFMEQLQDVHFISTILQVNWCEIRCRTLIRRTTAWTYAHNSAVILQEK